MDEIRRKSGGSVILTSPGPAISSTAPPRKSSVQLSKWDIMEAELCDMIEESGPSAHQSSWALPPVPADPPKIKKVTKRRSRKSVKNRSSTELPDFPPDDEPQEEMAEIFESKQSQMIVQESDIGSSPMKRRSRKAKRKKRGSSKLVNSKSTEESGNKMSASSKRRSKSILTLSAFTEPHESPFASEVLNNNNERKTSILLSPLHDLMVPDEPGRETSSQTSSSIQSLHTSQNVTNERSDVLESQRVTFRRSQTSNQSDASLSSKGSDDSSSIRSLHTSVFETNERSEPKSREDGEISASEMSSHIGKEIVPYGLQEAPVDDPFLTLRSEDQLDEEQRRLRQILSNTEEESQLVTHQPISEKNMDVNNDIKKEVPPISKKEKLLMMHANRFGYALFFFTLFHFAIIIMLHLLPVDDPCSTTLICDAMHATDCTRCPHRLNQNSEVIPLVAFPVIDMASASLWRWRKLSLLMGVFAVGFGAAAIALLIPYALYHRERCSLPWIPRCTQEMCPPHACRIRNIYSPCECLVRSVSELAKAFFLFNAAICRPYDWAIDRGRELFAEAQRYQDYSCTFAPAGIAIVLTNGILLIVSISYCLFITFAEYRIYCIQFEKEQRAYREAVQKTVPVSGPLFDDIEQSVIGAQMMTHNTNNSTESYESEPTDTEAPVASPTSYSRRAHSFNGLLSKMKVSSPKRAATLSEIPSSSGVRPEQSTSQKDTKMLNGVDTAISNPWHSSVPQLSEAHLTIAQDTRSAPEDERPAVTNPQHLLVSESHRAMAYSTRSPPRDEQPAGTNPSHLSASESNPPIRFPGEERYSVGGPCVLSESESPSHALTSPSKPSEPESPSHVVTSPSRPSEPESPSHAVTSPSRPSEPESPSHAITSPSRPSEPESPSPNPLPSDGTDSYELDGRTISRTEH